MYKIVSNIDGKLMSAVVHKYPQFEPVEYIPNQWVYPILPNSKLFVFDTKFAADIMLKMMNSELWECEVQGETPCRLAMSYVATTLRKEIVQFWSNNTSRYASMAIEGTFIANSVKLLRKI